jgi:flavin reductase (DIM6/NTAB) family NADH-FMN oxidoreductase RutF
MTALALVEPFRTHSHPAPVESEAFRLAMRDLASGVSLITHGVGRSRTGLTATSVSSPSADPPTLIVCINRASSLYSQIAVGDHFGVSVLAAGQEEYADVFAGRTGLKGAERFHGGRWLTAPSGVNLLADAVCTLECEVEDLIERHTYAIMIGRVRLARQGVAGGALVYWRGGYDQLGWSAEEVSRAIGLTPPPTCRAPT